MRMTVCFDCKPPGDYRRAFGRGTVIPIVLTFGLWRRAMPSYPKWCTACGATWRTKESPSMDWYASGAAVGRLPHLEAHLLRGTPNGSAAPPRPAAEDTEILGKVVAAASPT